MRLKLFIAFLVIASITFFTKENYRGVVDIVSQVLREPIQSEIASQNPITFSKYGFSYKVTPLYDYDIAGLVVHKQVYNAWYSLSRIDRVFPEDLCMIWGDNVRLGVYKNKGVNFAQDFRFCIFSYSGDIQISSEGISNNHMVIQNSALEKLAKTVSAGDQVRIRGKLVNVEALPISSPEKYEPNDLIWNTSITRTDTEGGACETIYVESIEILKQGNPISHILFTVSLYGLLLILLSSVWDLLMFFANDPLRPKF